MAPKRATNCIHSQLLLWVSLLKTLFARYKDWTVLIPWHGLLNGLHFCHPGTMAGQPDTPGPSFRKLPRYVTNELTRFQWKWRNVENVICVIARIFFTGCDLGPQCSYRYTIICEEKLWMQLKLHKYGKRYLIKDLFQ